MTWQKGSADGRAGSRGRRQVAPPVHLANELQSFVGELLGGQKGEVYSPTWATSSAGGREPTSLIRSPIHTATRISHWKFAGSALTVEQSKGACPGPESRQPKSEQTCRGRDSDPLFPIDLVSDR